MTNVAVLLAAAVAGGALGTLFFGGLWWTVQRGLTSEWPGSLFLGSLVVRMGVTLGGFWLVFGGEWPRLVACLLGFVVARWAVMRVTRPATEPPQLEGRHAPQS